MLLTKATNIAFSRYTFTFSSVLAVPGNQTHELGIASGKAILFELQE